MGKGEGLGEGVGEGVGVGVGEGAGESDTGLIVGGSLAICCMVCFIIIGLPMFIAGVVFVAIFYGSDPLYITGVVFIIVSLIMVFGVIGFGIYSCVQGSKRRENQPQQGGVVLTSSGGPAPVVIHQSVGGPQQPYPAGQYPAGQQQQPYPAYQGQPPAYQPPPQQPVPVYQPPAQGGYPPAGQPGIYPTQQLQEKY